ncbi:RNA-dependent RNA polymerase [Wuhan Louse Fly Virus 10]|uniref:Replicase n=1 Tax=Wuhan Louse Fly Virus 10 TaxID=1608114 RepID=A0A0B5KTQ6_9RHAB|nr:RNA-dependent RNA polymerase [Wuhan Louse Fly Virus 10]AJG39212.1 RNA-dependent RNA polymerase [Wuhan Louse Fly Virus 10]
MDSEQACIEDSLPGIDFESDPFNIKDILCDKELNKNVMKHLSNQDYSLNSALVIDELEAFTNWLKNDIASPRWKKSDWEILRIHYRSKMSLKTLKDPVTFTNWFGEFNLKTDYVKHPHFISIFDDSQSNSRLTRPVVDAFVLGVFGKILNWSKLDNIQLPNECAKWGSYFWELHLISLLLNCTTTKEARYLVSLAECELLITPFTKRTKYIFEYQTRNFGTCIVGLGYCNFITLRRLLDRNTILMLKDTYIARFNTLFTLTYRVDGLYGIKAFESMKTFYRLGDQILKEGGTRAYDSIKLIEPICNNRVANLAQQFRPSIPILNEFEQHIISSVEKAKMTTPSVELLYQKVEAETDVDIILTLYGSFRHWGHPYIDYFTGLEKLYEQVSLDKKIDLKYAELLASDLAFLVIKDQFQTKKWWPVDKEKVPEDHPLKKYIMNNTWPNNSTIVNFGDHWHELPLIKCFDIPDVVDPSIIYSDKSHSLTRSEIKNYLTLHPNSSIPSKKVLSTLLESPSTNWPEFLQRINDFGISIEHLVIGLKEKERELKIGGRFFALMSWEIRDYFVMTEYLIKTHFVPLFDGLTMADDLTTVIGKILRNTEGQGEDGYESVTFADHIDYEKWNNHQRGEANNPTFKVMGQFLGYPNLIQRTHEIFEKSWIYYNRRGDLLGIDDNDNLFNKGQHRVCWNGQAGGLEGLRQKGWSIVNLLILKRESRTVNTDIKVLAQGDNQVICSRYKLRKSRNPDQLYNNLMDISKNNKALMDRIAEGTGKLGLIINHDETMKSTEFLNYGKTCVFRGNIRNLETKRWSRVTCVTNDQLPTMANVLSTTSSNALTVSHFSDSPINSIILYNFYGHFVRIICEKHNPAIRGPLHSILKISEIKYMYDLYYLISSLYLDPSIGGVSGMSLTRFLIRVFPDPITESLTFLKIVHDNTSDAEIKKIMRQLGNPKILPDSEPDISKLLEDPLSLNIPHGIDAVNMIKERIKKSLYLSADKIQNSIVSKAVQHQRDYELSFVNHLREIEPLFPRFLSEYYAATYFGIVDTIIGLFQNSKTIRNQFKGSLQIEYDSIVIRSEVYSLKVLMGIIRRPPTSSQMWNCSASHADHLRSSSWGRYVHGATVPHPAEMLKIPELTRGICGHCNEPFPHYLYLSVLIPKGFKNLKTHKGTCSAYLGSSTLESTSILQHWEKETKVPLLRRAANLRNSIGWFIQPGSALAQSILNNLRSLTGEDWGEHIREFKRTGSALHRFSCSRQSSGGYAAQNPSKLTRMISTTNSFADLGNVNYDFMYQSCLLHGLMAVGELHHGIENQGFYHIHINCKDCVRPIEEITLNCQVAYNHEEVYTDLEKWKPEGSSWGSKTPIIEVPQGNWEILSEADKSYHIGIIQGFIFGDSIWGRISKASDPALFPLSLAKKVVPVTYMEGLLTGIIRSSVLSITHQRLMEIRDKYHSLIIGNACLVIYELIKNPNILNIWREESFQKLFASVSHRLSPSYPMIELDIGYSGSNYLIHLLVLHGPKFLKSKHEPRDSKIWIFSDTYRFEIVALLAIAEECWRLLLNAKLNKETRNQLKNLREAGSWIRTLNETKIDHIQIISRFLTPIIYTNQEVRHAAKKLFQEEVQVEKPSLNWRLYYRSEVQAIAVEFSPFKSAFPDPMLMKFRYQNPLISGLRLAQLATGSHYKMSGILEYLSIRPRAAICAGDGSGGLTALLIRTYPFCRVIFNSLCDYKDVRLKGNSPSPPSAILHASGNPEQCLNFRTNWQNPNDLSQEETWEYFGSIIAQNSLIIDLIVLDMEVSDEELMDQIEIYSLKYLLKIGAVGCVLIFKTYLTRIFGREENLLTRVKGLFSRVEVLTTSISSSQTAEVYIIISNPIQVGKETGIHPNLDSLWTEVQNFPLFKTPVSEFKRALELDKKDLLRGVPHYLKPNPVLELLGILEKLGIRSDLCHRYADTFGNKPPNPYIPFHLLMLSIHGLVPYTTGFREKSGPPSDGVVLRLSALISGFFIWMGLKLKNFPITKLGQKLIDEHVPFSYESIKQNNLYFHSFSLYERRKVTKILQLDSEMALIGNVIRVLQLNFSKATRFPNVKHINSYCEKFNKAITYSWFGKTTGLIKILRLEKDILLEKDHQVKQVSLISADHVGLSKELTYRD